VRNLSVIELLAALRAQTPSFVSVEAEVLGHLNHAEHLAEEDRLEAMCDEPASQRSSSAMIFVWSGTKVL